MEDCKIQEDKISVTEFIKRLNSAIHWQENGCCSQEDIDDINRAKKIINLVLKQMKLDVVR